MSPAPLFFRVRLASGALAADHDHTTLPTAPNRMQLCRSARAWMSLALVAAAACAPVRREAPNGAHPSAPPLEVRIDERYYEVEGMTPRELNHALREKGPRADGHRRRWHGLTDFALRYRYEPRPWADGCRAVEARVEVEVVTTLPEWPDREAASPMLREDWDLFLTRLREHEQGHQRIAILLGRDLLREVEALRAADCDALRAQAKRLASAFEQAADLEHRSWDQETDHGVSGGG